MPDQYADIAEKYRQAKQHPWRRHIEAFTLFDLLGDLTDKAVLDLACGEGFYTRQFKTRGAARVVGVDISPAMIDLARTQEAHSPLGIEYRVGDVAETRLPGTFDIVSAAYLLNYARTREELLALCQAVANALPAGGRFVSVNDNPEQPVEAFGGTRPLGVIKKVDGPLREGIAVTFVLFDDAWPGPIEFNNYWFHPQTYEWALRSAGLGDVRWHAPSLAPQEELGRDECAAFLQRERSPVVFLECVKV